MSSHVAVTSSTNRAGSREAHMHVRVSFFDSFQLICCRVMDIWPCWLCRPAAMTMEQYRLRFLGPTRAWWHQVVPGQRFIRPAANLSCPESFCTLFYYFWFLSSRYQDYEDVCSNSWPSHGVLFNAFRIFSYMFNHVYNLYHSNSFYAFPCCDLEVEDPESVWHVVMFAWQAWVRFAPFRMAVDDSCYSPMRLLLCQDTEFFAGDPYWGLQKFFHQAVRRLQANLSCRIRPGTLECPPLASVRTLSFDNLCLTFIENVRRHKGLRGYHMNPCDLFHVSPC